MADVLTKETDARFWASTGYKPGKRLDASDPQDRAHMKAWMDIYAKVKAEDARGQLHLTYNHPEVAKDLNDAALAHASASAHQEAAAAAPDVETQQHHERAALLAHGLLEGAVTGALMKQPPTASPASVHAATTDAHRTAGLPPPRPPVFTSDHPVHSSPTAQPAHAELAHPESKLPVPRPPVHGSTHAGLLQSGRAPQRVGHAHAHARPVHPTVPSAHVAHFRARGREIVLERLRLEPTARFIGIIVLPSGEEQIFVFATHAELVAWHHQHLGGGPPGSYVAVYDRDAPVWPDAIADGFGGEPRVIDPETLPQAPMIPPDQVPPAPIPTGPRGPCGESPEQLIAEGKISPEELRKGQPAGWTPPAGPAPASKGEKKSNLLLWGGVAAAVAAGAYFLFFNKKGGGGSRSRSPFIP